VIQLLRDIFHSQAMREMFYFKQETVGSFSVILSHCLEKSRTNSRPRNFCSRFLCTV